MFLDGKQVHGKPVPLDVEEVFRNEQFYVFKKLAGPNHLNWRIIGVPILYHLQKDIAIPGSVLPHGELDSGLRFVYLSHYNDKTSLNNTKHQMT